MAVGVGFLTCFAVRTFGRAMTAAFAVGTITLTGYTGPGGDVVSMLWFDPDMEYG